jgi:hypothetical protein
MDAKTITVGIWGLLLAATPAFADPPLAATEKAYRLLQTISSQLQEVRMSIAASDSTPAAALAKAQEQVRIAAAHYCHVLYAAQLTAAKAALTRGDQQQTMRYLLKANETLEKCPAPPEAGPRDRREESESKAALARQ